MFFFFLDRVRSSRISNRNLWTLIFPGVMIVSAEGKQIKGLSDERSYANLDIVSDGLTASSNHPKQPTLPYQIEGSLIVPKQRERGP